MNRVLSLGLIIVGTTLVGCGAVPVTSVGDALSSDTVPSSAPAEVIEGLDGQAFIDALTAEGFVCEGPRTFTSALQQWNCAAQATDVSGVGYEVVILGESLSAVHSIDASVDQLSTSTPDDNLSGGFLAFIAETAAFTGSDADAARAWVAENASTESVQFDVNGVTYNLRGPAGLRALEIVASE